MHEQPDRLAHVQRGAAAHGEDRVGTGRAIRVDASKSVGVRRIRLELAEHREADAGSIEQRRHSPEQPRLEDPFVGDEEQLARADALKLGRKLADGAAAVHDPGGKRHGGRHGGLHRERIR